MGAIAETKLVLSISAAILLKQGEISTEDIRSFSFVSQDFNAKPVIDSLLRLYDTELICNKVSSKPFLKWEETIRLRQRPQMSKR